MLLPNFNLLFFFKLAFKLLLNKQTIEAEGQKSIMLLQKAV